MANTPLRKHGVTVCAPAGALFQQNAKWFIFDTLHIGFCVLKLEHIDFLSLVRLGSLLQGLFFSDKAKLFVSWPLGGTGWSGWNPMVKRMLCSSATSHLGRVCELFLLVSLGRGGLSIN